MTTTYKVLGQMASTANTLSTIYTVPSATSAVLSTVTICNTGGSNANVSLSVCVGNAANTISQYVVYNNNLIPSDTLTLTLGLTLAATDTLRGNASIGNVVFNAFGSEIT